MRLLHHRTKEAYKLMHDGILAFARAERQGMRVDLDYIERKKEFLTKKITKLENEFKDTNFFKHWQHTTKGTVNIYSNAQLSYFLYSVKKLKPDKQTDSGQGSTDEESLQQLGIPELNVLLQITKLKKVRDTYLSAFAREQVDGYLHPFFNLHLARMYRSSSDSPNFQNIPKRDEEAMNMCRKALFPRPGHQLLEADFSGLEVRIAACYHKDKTMVKYITDPTTDMHGDMAKQIFMIDNFDKKKPSHYTLRQAAKNGFVFPEFYGSYYKNCAINMACTWGKLPQGKWKPGTGLMLEDETLSDHLIARGFKSLNDFSEHLRVIEKDFWENRFAGYSAWKESHWKIYQKYGYIDLFTGFRCSGVMSKNDVSNYPVQGAAFHCLLWSFIEIDRISREENWNTKLIGQIHDAIILDVDPAELEHVKKTVRRVTCEDLPKAWSWIIVPLDIEMEICPVDGSWVEKTHLK